MTTTHDDNATTWRDLADSLRPEQSAYIQDWESHPELPPRADGKPAPYGAHKAGLLFTARQYVAQNAAGALYTDVASPPEDGQHYQWEDNEDGTWSRFFVGTSRKVGDTDVLISGRQSTDGTIVRTVNILGDSEDLCVRMARQLATALVDAADELERLQ